MMQKIIKINITNVSLGEQAELTDFLQTHCFSWTEVIKHIKGDWR